MWDDGKLSELKTFKEAIDLCDAKNTGGYIADWRIPNYNELFSLVNYNKSTIKFDDRFVNKVANLYWTSTISKRYYDNNATLNRAWAIDFSSGYDYRFGIDDENKVYTICVHDLD